MFSWEEVEPRPPWDTGHLCLSSCHQTLKCDLSGPEVARHRLATRSL